MKRYESYKDSGVYYLPLLPSKWEIKKAKFLFREEKRLPRINDEIITCFRDGQVTLRKNRRTEGFTNSLKEIGYKGIRKGDLVIHNMDAFAGAIGVSDSDGKGTPVYSICTTLSDNISPYYYCYFLRYLAKCDFIKSLSKGIRERSTDFRFNDFKELILPVPSIYEQNKIVEYIDSVTSKIDEAISQQQKMIDLLNERKQIIIQNAVTKGLDPNAKMKDSGVEWIGEIPEDWTKITLKRVFNTRIAGSWGNDENQGYKNTICLRIADFDYSKLKFKDSKSYTIRSYSEKEILNKSIKRGDLLIEKSGGGEKTPVGRMVVYDLDLNNPMYANFMEKLSVRYFANSYYINYIMSAFYHSRAIWPYVKATTGIQNLDITNLLANEIIFIPSLSEQLSIVNYICSKTSQIDNDIHQCNKMITLLQERKQIIINDVVTGKIKVI